MTDIAFAIAEIILIISYLFRDILYLRIATIFGLAGYVVGGFIAGISAEGMKALIILNALGILINCYQIAKIIIDRVPILLPSDIKDIYTNCFHYMTPKEFLKVYKSAITSTYRRGDVLCVQDQPILTLMMIKSGSVSIVKDGKEVSQLGPQYFIGEMSFLTHNNATATVAVASEYLECITWDKDKLNKIQAKDENLFQKLNHVIAVNLIKKLTH